MVITINIPEGGRCLLKENQKVDFGVPYLEGKSESKIEIQVAKKLDIEPAKIFHYLKKLVGEKIKKGETLALNKSLFSTSRVKSEYDGTIQEINHNDGVVVITTEVGDDKTFDAFFKGKVKKIDKDEIKIEVASAEEFKISNSTASFGGGTFYLKDTSSDMTSSNISANVVLAKSVSPFTQIKAEALGTAGFVTLNKIEERIDEVQYAQLKNIADVEKIYKLNYPYCLIDKKNSRIVFYK
jgi:glycine cleavage system H lipoate-binding protein